MLYKACNYSGFSLYYEESTGMRRAWERTPPRTPFFRGTSSKAE